MKEHFSMLAKTQVALFVATLLSGCAYQLPAIEAKQIKTPNPTSYIYSSPILKVRAQIDTLCKRGDKTASEFETPASKAISSCHRDREGLDSRGLYRYTESFRPEMQSDEVQLIGRSFTDAWFIRNYYSRTYYYSGGSACPVSFDILLVIEAIDEQKTRVSASVTRMSTPKGYYPGMHGARQTVGAQLLPTSIEEYEVLYFLGKRLGESDMPAVRLP